MFALIVKNILRTFLFALAIFAFYQSIRVTKIKIKSNIGKTWRQDENQNLEFKEMKTQLNFHEEYHNTSKGNVVEGDYVGFSFGQGNFGGYKRLLDLLGVKNSNLARPENSKSSFPGCHLVLGDTTNVRNQKYWKMKNIVWLSVNAEDPANQQIWTGRKKTQNPQKKTMQTRINTSNNHRQLILGNFWKKGKKDYVRPGLGVISLWIPFLSLNFNERLKHTPLDLNRPASSLHKRSYSAAYMNSVCVPFREKLWDEISAMLSSKNGLKFRADALGKCHGSVPRNGAEQLKDGHYSYDGHVKTYERYDFVACAEHNQNDIGYVTEKIANVILAGRVPIYGGYSQIGSIINPKRFIMHNKLKEFNYLLHNDTKYYQMIDEPAVSREAMVEHFSWHPAVISKYSDDKLRQKIFGALTQLCNDIKVRDFA